MLEISGLSVAYGKHRALDDVKLSVAQREIVVILGANGSGKTSLLKAIAGIVPKSSAEVSLSGRDIQKMRANDIVEAGLALVPEGRGIFGELTVRENLDVGCQPARHWPDGTPLPVWTIQRVFDLFPNLAAMPARWGARMSGGEQQMLTVARTLMGNPFLVLLDEPSEGVAPIVVEQMARAILELKAHGVSVLLCEQNLAFASLVADRVCLLDQGEIRYRAGMPEFLLDTAARDRYLGL